MKIIMGPDPGGTKFTDRTDPDLEYVKINYSILFLCLNVAF